MRWRDFFYFSTGERRALTLLLTIIALGWLFISYTDRIGHEQSSTNSKVPTSKLDTIRIEIKHETIEVPESKPKESTKVSTRADKIPPKNNYKRSSYPKKEKFLVGTIVELNAADSTTLKKVPGIGPVFSRRIVKYRELLGGFYTVEQLSEVYGIDEERYESLKTWFIVDTNFIRKIPVNQRTFKQLAAHPYISYKQARTIEWLRNKKGMLRGWEDFTLLEEFSEYDRERLLPYLSFTHDSMP